MTEKLVMYALGGKVAYQDMTQVRAIVRDAANRDYRFASQLPEDCYHGVSTAARCHCSTPSNAWP